jgi:hypothetical protein
MHQNSEKVAARVKIKMSPIDSARRELQNEYHIVHRGDRTPWPSGSVTDSQFISSGSNPGPKLEFQIFIKFFAYAYFGL